MGKYKLNEDMSRFAAVVRWLNDHPSMESREHKKIMSLALFCRPQFSRAVTMGAAGVYTVNEAELYRIMDMGVRDKFRELSGCSIM